MNDHVKLRIRVAVFLLLVVALIFLLNGIVKGINTLNRLDLVEGRRDQWQKPTEVINALQLREGNVVADLGSGSGYFALKLSRRAGASGRVLAVDIRRLPLTVLWIRALLSNQLNLSVQLANPDDPRLPAGQLDAVLISNTYHELSSPHSMLAHVRISLRPGGRLVIVDRSLASNHAGKAPRDDHEIDPGLVVNQVQGAGFEILSRQDRFVDSADGEQWWLIAARRPYR